MSGKEKEKAKSVVKEPEVKEELALEDDIFEEFGNPLPGT